MEIKGYEKFIELRNSVMEKLSKEYIFDGTFEIVFSYPSYFEMNGDWKNDIPNFVIIILHGYFIGLYRKYEWYGETIEEAVNKARKEIKSWED